jgi:hypothetical protein
MIGLHFGRFIWKTHLVTLLVSEILRPESIYWNILFARVFSFANPTIAAQLVFEVNFPQKIIKRTSLLQYLRYGCKYGFATIRDRFLSAKFSPGTLITAEISLKFSAIINVGLLHFFAHITAVSLAGILSELRW